MKPRGVILLLLLFLACVARAQNPVFLLTPGGGGASLPTQAGQSGQFLTTNGTTADWVAVPGGGDLLAANNLSDLASASTSRTNLGATTVGAGLFTLPNPTAVRFIRINADNTITSRSAAELLADIGAQASDADLTTYAGITPAANVQTFLGAADYAAMRTQLGLVIGTNVQAWNANLDTFALIAPAANTVTFLGAANYAAMRTQLDLALDASSFNGNLSTSDDTLQEVSQKLDDLTLGGAAPGANTNVIFNDSGVYGADADFTWDKTNNVLSVPGISVTTLNSIAFKILDAVNQSHGLSFIVSTDLTAEKTFTYTGAFNFAMTLSADTSVTFPTTGTLATLAGTETFTNKTLTSPTLTTPSLGVATVTSLNGKTKWDIGYRDLPVQQAKLPATAPAQIDAGENNWRLLFDDTTVETCLWQFVLPQDYGTAPVLRILYSMTSATTGSVAFDCAVMATTPGDSADINTDSYATVNATTDAVPGTAGHLGDFTITLTNADSAAAGDLVKLKISRPADAVTGDMEVVGVMLEYTKQ